jgi:hypothetical protein
MAQTPGHEEGLRDLPRELEPIMMDLGYCGQRWARDMVTDDLDTRSLAWSVHKRLDTQAMPKGRTVLEFELELAGEGPTAAAYGSFTATAPSTCVQSIRVTRSTYGSCPISVASSRHGAASGLASRR